MGGLPDRLPDTCVFELPLPVLVSAGLAYESVTSHCADQRGSHRDISLRWVGAKRGREATISYRSASFRRTNGAKPGGDEGSICQSSGHLC